jgi:hypothetical protein
VRNHSVTAAEGVLGIAERVLFGSRLWEPYIASISTELARFECLSDIFLHDDSTTGGVDEPCTCKKVSS